MSSPANDIMESPTNNLLFLIVSVLKTIDITSDSNDQNMNVLGQNNMTLEDNKNVTGNGTVEMIKDEARVKKIAKLEAILKASLKFQEQLKAKLKTGGTNTTVSPQVLQRFRDSIEKLSESSAPDKTKKANIPTIKDKVSKSEEKAKKETTKTTTPRSEMTTEVTVNETISTESSEDGLE